MLILYSMGLPGVLRALCVSVVQLFADGKAIRRISTDPLRPANMLLDDFRSDTSRQRIPLFQSFLNHRQDVELHWTARLKRHHRCGRRRPIPKFNSVLFSLLIELGQLSLLGFLRRCQEEQD